MSPEETKETNAMIVGLAVGLPVGLASGYAGWKYSQRQTSSKFIGAIVSIVSFNLATSLAGRLAYVAAKVAMR